MAKDLAWLAEVIKTPPFSVEARREAGRLLRLLQDGEMPQFPAARPMPVIGAGAHELRIEDADVSWRVFLAIRPGEIVILAVQKKKSQKTPKKTLELCAKRLRDYDATED